MQATEYMLFKADYAFALSTDNRYNMCTVLEVVDFNIAFCLNYLLLTICIKKIPSFEANMILII